MNNLKKEKSCGCLIIEKGKVLLIQRTKGHWGFPKGHIDVEINANKRYTMEYITDKGTLKQVVLFIARKIGGNEKYQESEIKSMKWMSYKDALKIITYENTRELFEKILKDENL